MYYLGVSEDIFSDCVGIVDIVIGAVLEFENDNDVWCKVSDVTKVWNRAVSRAQKLALIDSSKQGHILP